MKKKTATKPEHVFGVFIVLRLILLRGAHTSSLIFLEDRKKSSCIFVRLLLRTSCPARQSAQSVSLATLSLTFLAFGVEVLGMLGLASFNIMIHSVIGYYSEPYNSLKYSFLNLVASLSSELDQKKKKSGMNVCALDSCLSDVKTVN